MNYGFLIFVFFFIIFILLLTGGSTIRYLKKAKHKAKKAAEEKAQSYRDETGRQQRQYHYSGQNATPRKEAKPRAEQESESEREKSAEVHTQTATGETIIDRRTNRESKKIYEETEGEYVEFSEE